MEQCNWWMERQPQRGGWKCVREESGGPSAMTTGHTKTPTSSVESWAFFPLVYPHIEHTHTTLFACNARVAILRPEVQFPWPFTSCPYFGFARKEMQIHH